MELDSGPSDCPDEDFQPRTPGTTEDLVELRNTEDSGYHTPFTSFTSGFSDSGFLNSSSVRRVSRIRNPNSATRKRRAQLVRFRAINSFGSTENESLPGTSYESNNSLCPDESSQFILRRRPQKRSFDQSEDRISCVGLASTPTSAITGDLEKLHVESPAQVLTPAPEFTSDYFSLSSIGECSKLLSYPTTPVKSSKCKIAKLSPKCERRSTTKKSPSKELKENVVPRKAIKKLHYTLVEVKLEPPTSDSKPKATTIPDKKIDIVSMLEAKKIPDVRKILRFLGAVDLYNFSNVCQTWRDICNQDKKSKDLRDNYARFITETKENCSVVNRTPAESSRRRQSQDGDKFKLRTIQNFTKSVPPLASTERTPPGTPRTNRLRKFVKCGSLDERMQLQCVRCRHPAKVTKESSGEQWALCLNSTCSFSFCRFCNCEHHPGKTCHSLDAPSPTKRRKQSVGAHFDSKKCRKNLRRLKT